jgi:mannose-1-phosphate guanylyltransferase
MLEHTIERADSLGKREHQLTLIAKAHQREAQSQLSGYWPGKVIVQPSNRDTFPGIFLPLTHVYARDSKAMVVIYPSDHFIHPEKRFTQVIENAVKAAEELPHMVVLIGVPADSPELDYGWICPGPGVWQSGKHSVYKVKQFLEKPSQAAAIAAMAVGGLWNTMIIVAKAHTLWQLGWRYFPQIMKHFERLHNAIGASCENDVLEEIYEVMPAQNFSTGLLVQAANQISVMPMKGVLWSDWGRENRIVETLNRIGKKPNFPTVFPAAGSPVPQVAEQISADYISINP